MKRSISILMFLSIISSLAVNGQTAKTVEADVSQSTVVLLGKTKEVRDMNNAVEYRSTKAKFKKDKKRPPNFIGRRSQSKAILFDLEHQGPDPIRQMEGRSSGSLLDVEPTINVDGINSNFGSPNDPTGDVGLEYYVQSINATDVGVFDKVDGSLVLEFPMQNLWSDFGANSAGDPIILFDEIEGRWFITEFTDPANLLIAVSVTSDPLGSYYAYNFSTPNFPDYPKYAIWPEALVVTTNEEGGGTLHQYFIEKSSLINGETTAVMQRIAVSGNNGTEAGFYVSTPVDVDGALDPSDPRPIAVALDDSSWGNAPEDRINIYRFDIDWDNVNNTVIEEFNIVTTPFDSYPCSAAGFGFSCVPQLDGNGLDAIPEVIMNIPKIRRFADHESMVMSFVTDATDGDNISGIRWVELRKAIGVGEWSIFQEGTYAPDDGLDRYMCSVAMDVNGHIGLGYNVSSAETYVGVRFTGRLASDPLGEMSVTEYEAVAGGSTINSFGRFGDYSQMGVDPVNGTTFWFTTEYAGNNGVRTRIVAFELMQNQFDLAAINIESPVTSASLTANESVTFQVSNVGLTNMVDYTIGFNLEGIMMEEVVINDELVVGDSYTHTFDNTIDLSAIGSYTIEAYVIHPDDEGAFNNITSTIVQHLLATDAGVFDLQLPEETCIADVEVSATISNEGFNTMTSAEIEYSVNGTVEGSTFWTGSLENNESDIFSFNVTITDGNNDIEAAIISVNGEMDQNADNDISIGSIALVPGAQFILSILTDDFPGETTWEIVNESNQTMAEGGPYADTGTDYERTICLDPEDCYTFTMFDSFGDGICCDFGIGLYTMSYEGDVIFEGGDFESTVSHTFCGDGTVDGIFEQVLEEGQFDLVLSPNPNDGYFQVSLTTDRFSSPMIDMEIYDINGKMIQNRRIAKYDDTYVTTVSLVEYASGTYFLKLRDGAQSVSQLVIRR